jgi:predicted dehydrogenase
MPRIRTGVVGVGHFGSLHAAKYAAEPTAELVAVADIDPRRASEVAARHGIFGTSELADLIGMVEAVSIAVPTTAHYEVARFFMDHGVHVLLEKPITSTIQQADDLIHRARSKKLVFQAGHLERFFIAETGLQADVSEPLYIETVRNAPFSTRGLDVSVVLDLMIHDIDLIAFLVGAPVERVDAVGVPLLSDFEDLVNTRIEFASGCVANLTASRVAGTGERRMRIFESDRMLCIDFMARKVATTRRASARPLADMGAEGFEDVSVVERHFAEHDPLGQEIRAFVNSIATGSEPVVTGEHGRDALALGTRIIESLQASATMARPRVHAGGGVLHAVVNGRAGR